MYTIISKDVQDSLDSNCSNRTDKTHLKRRNSKLPSKKSPVFDLVKHSKENTFNLLNIKQKQNRKEDIVQGKILKIIVPFLDVLLVAKSYFTFC